MQPRKRDEDHRWRQMSFSRSDRWGRNASPADLFLIVTSQWGNPCRIFYQNLSGLSRLNSLPIVLTSSPTFAKSLFPYHLFINHATIFGAYSRTASRANYEEFIHRNYQNPVDAGPKGDILLTLRATQFLFGRVATIWEIGMTMRDDAKLGYLFIFSLRAFELNGHL